MRLFFTFCCLLVGSAIFGQNNHSVLTGKLVDSAAKQPLALATITVFQAKDTNLVTYRMSNNEGIFKITGLPADIPLRVIISFSGFGVYRKEFQLKAGEQKDLGIIGMIPSSKDMEEVLVFAERPPVIIRQDTIEFNASAFKTLPTALVEDLLKKLPGVQVDASGNITVDGRKVNRLMVDGKDFFGTDPRMATRNLPANIIDKVQVTEDKDEAELNPDKLPAELGQVINLKLKKSIKKGWFGKAYAGGGSDERYETGSILNLFRDTLQLSLLGFSNNIDRAGFGLNDIRSLGGFDRSGLDDYVINARGLSVNGISFGGQGEGINTSTGAGFNLNNVFKNGVSLNTQYFYGQSRNDITERANRQQFFGDTVLSTLTDREEVQRTYNHRIGFGLKGKPGANSRFEFKPSLIISDQQSESSRSVDNIHSVKGLLNKGSNDSWVKGNTFSYDHSLVFFKTFPAKKGRSFNLSNQVSYSKGDNDQTTIALTRFYISGVPYDSTIDQLRDRSIDDLTTSLTANWNEPLNKKFTLRFNYSGTIGRSEDNLTTFNKNNNGKYEDINPGLSNALERISWRNNFSPSLGYTNKSFTVVVSFNLVSIGADNRLGKDIAPFKQQYSYIFPGVNIRWKQLLISYSQGANLPSLRDLQPVVDNTNPLYVNKGNPDLLPTTVHNIRLNWVKRMPEKSTFFRTGLIVNFRENFVVRARSIRPDGVQETIPVNVNGVFNISPTAALEKQQKFNKDFRLTYSVVIDGGYNRNYVIINGNKGEIGTLNFIPSVNSSFNWKDKIELTMSYSRSDRFGKLRNKAGAIQDLNTNTASFSSELVIRWPKNFVVETQLDQRYNRQAAPGIQKTVTLWNAAVNYLFLQDGRGQLKCTVYDLLRSNNNVTRVVNENYIQDRQLSMLTRYFLLTFTYNIRDFKTGKVGGRQKFFFF
jgi:hypothetical protein